MELTNNTWTYISPLIAALLTYFIAIRGKRKDVDIEKERKLNIVISNLLDVWYYLGRMRKITDLNKSDFPIPLKIIPHFLLNSKNLNDKCFRELESSIELLKEYDPITYYELSGIGNRFDYIKTNLILPFLNASNQTDFNKKISETYIQETIAEIENYLKSVSKRLGYKVALRIKRKIKTNQLTDVEEIKKELIKYYYDFMMALIPANQVKPTIEKFGEELSQAETQTMISEQMELLKNTDFGQVMNLVAENPYYSIDEMKDKLEIKASR
ncbi:hypothetical protein INQ51_08025 [Maribellus sp. CM-23]|uniref:hypothetical protein n=1 Tax=Maribellus sp. CM-23 TaxID=2781026 RepID=UPI001F2EC2B0|nr:hypothetical protein [Maribellus sp. CM-23]MCE4564257.1 hypothetical protein [Maribellus sp. CM-23]